MQDIQSAVTQINADPRIDAARFVIHDFRSAQDLEEGVSAMLALTGHQYGRTPYNLAVKTAVLVAKDDLQSRFNSLALSSPRPLRAFATLDRAEAWIGTSWQQSP